MAKSKGVTLSQINQTELEETLGRWMPHHISSNCKAGAPLFVWGPPGIGKSEIIRAFCQSVGYKYIDVRLSLMGPLDLMGIPFRNPETGKAEWSEPEILPDADNEGPGLLFFDELPIANRAVQGAALQLIWDRKVGRYSLPDKWAIIAAGNQTEFNLASNELIAPLKNRFIHLYLTPDPVMWYDWATDVTDMGDPNIHPIVSEYILLNTGEIFSEKQVSASETHAYPTPRSWTIVSDLIKSLDMLTHGAWTSEDVGDANATMSQKDVDKEKKRIYNDLTRDQIVYSMISGAIGSVASAKFRAYTKMMYDGSISLIPPFQVIKDTLTQGRTEVVKDYLHNICEYDTALAIQVLHSISSYANTYIQNSRGGKITDRNGKVIENATVDAHKKENAYKMLIVVDIIRNILDHSKCPAEVREKHAEIVRKHIVNKNSDVISGSDLFDWLR